MYSAVTVPEDQCMFCVPDSGGLGIPADLGRRLRALRKPEEPAPQGVAGALLHARLPRHLLEGW